MKNQQFICGSWWSTKPGATASGLLLLAIDSEGEFMAGCFVGPNQKGNRLLAPLVFGRTKDKVLSAKKWLDFDVIWKLTDELPPSD